MARRAFSIGYGKGQIDFELDDTQLLTDFVPDALNAETDEEKTVIKALAEPIGSLPIPELFSPGDTVAIVTCDITRACPTSVILPPLIQTLNEAGIRDEDITVVFAIGSHHRHTEEEMRMMAGEEIYNRVHTIDSDPEDTVCVGLTSSGTPVNIFSAVAQADRRILIGNIEYHPFAGYTGGGEAILPGVTDWESLEAHQRLMADPFARAGKIDGNPVRRDIEESTDLCGCDHILNVVLDPEGRIAQAFAGDHRKAHRAGCAFLDRHSKVKLPREADIVIASSGGNPYDTSLYQITSSLDMANHAVKQGGIIILAGECADHFGDLAFEDWFDGITSQMALHREFAEGEHPGNPQAAIIVRTLAKADVFLVSDMPDEAVRSAFMNPYHDLDQAIIDAFARTGARARAVVLAKADRYLPEPENNT